MNTKFVAITPPGAISDNASPTTASIDTKGFNFATIIVHFGAMDIAMAAFKLQESDTDSNYADITGANFSTGTLSNGSAAALPSATADNGFWAFQVPLQGRKRYLDLVITTGDGAAGTYVTAFALLSNADEAPNTFAERGFAGEIIVL